MRLVWILLLLFFASMFSVATPTRKDAGEAREHAGLWPAQVQRVADQVDARNEFDRKMQAIIDDIDSSFTPDEDIPVSSLNKNVLASY